MSLIYKECIILSAIIGILLQCEIGTSYFSLSTFRMFTTLSNLAVAIFYIVYIFRERNHKVIRYFKFLITMCILLTGLVAHFMLAELFVNMRPMVKCELVLLHYVVPISTVFDWILFDEKGMTDKKMPLFASSFPIVYVLFIMATAPFMQGSEKYPYPFLNVDIFGVGMVSINIICLAVAFLVCGHLGVWIDHQLVKKK